VSIQQKIPLSQTSHVHGIDESIIVNKKPISYHLDRFIDYCDKANVIVGHNINFDVDMVIGELELLLKEKENPKFTAFINRLKNNFNFCTMKKSANKCLKTLSKMSPNTMSKYNITMNKNKNYIKKGYKLLEVHELLFDEKVNGQLHNALVDIAVTLRVYMKLVHDIDICGSVGSLQSPRSQPQCNKDICNLIKPSPIKKSPLIKKEKTPIIGSINSLEQEVTAIEIDKTKSLPKISVLQSSPNDDTKTVMTIKSKLKTRFMNARKTAKRITQQSINEALKKMLK
jgi:DNA polymerase III epsilon subunit-like protein